MYLQAFYLLLSIVGLYFGAEFALDSAEKIGRFFGLSPLVIGLLIVGFGTSLPEFFVSHLACMRDESGIALGNIIGSNIANIYLILGVSSLLTILFITRRDLRVEIYFHIGETVLLTGILIYGKLNLITVGAAMTFFGFYLGDAFRQMKKDRHLRKADDVHQPKINPMDFVKLLIGFVLLYASGELLVFSGSGLGKALGISPYVISAVFVAFGTSFPELVTAMLACMKKKNTDLITGNIIGSNIFNVSLVMGTLGFYGVDIPAKYNIEIGYLIFAALLLLVLSLLKKNLTRISGVLFLGGYGYLVFMWFQKGA